MIEIYALLAALLVQILVVSVLHSAWVCRYFLQKFEIRSADERYARLFPGWDRTRMERFLARFRAANIAVAVLGVVPLFLLFDLLQSPDWDIWWARRIVSFYFLAQILPMMGLVVNRLLVHRKASRLAPPEPKRTATLQRRTLFDFVSPATVFLAILTYVLGAALSLYFLEYPVPEISHPLRPLAATTQSYVVCGLTIYWILYGKKTSPLETRAERMFEAAFGIRVMFTILIALVVFTWLNLGLEVLHVERWIPFSASIFQVAMILIMSRSLVVAPRLPETPGHLRHDEALS